MPPERSSAGLVPPRASVRRVSRPQDGARAERLRLLVYGLGLCVAFGLYLLVQGPGRGLAFWLPGLVAGGAVAAGLATRGGTLGTPFRWGATMTFLLALAVPLGPLFLAGAPLAELAGSGPLWPQILVCLFASRVLSEICDMRFAAAWRRPLGPNGSVQIQSGAAALALGACFTLAFYQAVWLAAPERAGAGSHTLTALVWSALTGESAIHRSIVALFFVILAYLCDAGLQHRRDREALASLRGALAAGGPGPSPLPDLLAGPLAPYGHTRTVRYLADALARREARGMPARADLATDAFEAFHAASRRFLRGLLPFLPLLGFFGTVVGLATAMAALPSAGSGAQADLSGSLAGLALKFETTLLGILASMIASVLLAQLEKRETELAAECSLLAAAAERADAP